MDVQLLEDIGLTNSQAMAYKALVAAGPCTAPALSAIIRESRSNTYKLLDKLCELELASKDDAAPKIRYTAASPTALERFMQKQSAAAQLRERKLAAHMPAMLDFFFTHSEQPSIRYFQGKEGIQQIFGDMLKTGQPIYLLRSPADVDFYDEAFFSRFRKRRAALGIKTYALTPDVSTAVHDREADFQNAFVRTWLQPNDYTAPVEWDIYGNKVALISYGKEAMGIIIESRQIAESFRQMFLLVTKLRAGAHTQD